MRSLRSQLILSHILPIVVTVPLIGIALFYILQTQVLLSNLANEVQAQAILLVEMTSQRIDIWSDPQGAQEFVARISPRLNAQVMLVSASGNLLAASSPEEQQHVGERMSLAGLADALSGKSFLQAQYNPLKDIDAVQMLVPVLDQNQRLLGIVRLNLPVSSMIERVGRLRSWLGWVLGGGLLLGGALGWGLAFSLEKPLRRTTGAIAQLTRGERREPVEEKGPNELRLLIRAFNELSERLKTLEENRGRLLANLVHELGRPLGALHSAVDALTHGADQDAALRKELLGGMGGELHRLERLVDDLARLHDQVVGALELNRQTLRLEPWLTNVLAPWREAAAAKNLGWETEWSAAPAEVYIDPDRMAQTVGNLASNAVKFTPAGGKITVRAGEQGERWFIQVEDNGPGMTASEVEKSLDPFFRGPEAHRFPQGMGLGLSIARDLAAAHGGQIEVQSEPGKGSRFTIWIPATRGEA